MSFINIPVFLVSLIFGLFYMYISSPTKKSITVYPTQDNISLFQFRDKTQNCFQLKQNIVKCSNDAEHIPIQI